MAAFRGHDMTWLQTGWEHNQGSSGHIRHYRTSVPRVKGASRNSLLQCNKMSVKTKQVDDKTRQIRVKYGSNNLERNFKKGVDITPFITKVQIKKTYERSRPKSAGRTTTRKGNANERVQFAIGSDETRAQNGDCPVEHALPGQDENEIETKIDEEHSENKNDLSGEIITVEMNTKPEDTLNYLYPPETSEEERTSVQQLIKYLSRRFRDPTEPSRRQTPATRPTAAYARPTKGEIALSVKGPVLLAPVSKVVKASNKQNRLDVATIPEFTSARNERVCNRPISSVSDSIVLTGRKIHGTGRVTWPECERAQSGSFDQIHRQCQTCRDQHFSSSDTNITRERAKSAVCGNKTRQRKSEGCLPQLLRQSPAKLQDGIVNNTHSSLQKRSRLRNGMISPFELQVNLDQLKSYDYGSPVPPPSLSNSDDEEITLS